MNLNRRQIISYIRKLKFSFLFLLYIVGEMIESYYPNQIHSIIEKTIRINPLNMTNVTGLAYFSITNAYYPNTYDELFNFSIDGTIINRHVQYCQKDNSFRFFTPNVNNNQYKSKWVSNLNDAKNKYPPLSIMVNETFYFNNVTIGNLTILSSFYTDDLLFYYFEPNQENINNFTYSKASSEFEFIHKGFFYHSATNESAITRLENIKNALSQNEYEYEDILYEAQEIMFQNCHPGDVRVRYLLFAPANATYFGFVHNYSMDYIMIDETRYGSVRRGANQSISSLVKAYAPNGIYYQSDSLDEIFRFSYPHIVKFKIAFDFFRLILNVFITDPIRLAYWFLTAGFTNMLIKSLIWDCWYLDPYLWASALVTMIIFGLICGLWKIQLRPTNNQVVNVHVHLDRDAAQNMQQVFTELRNANIQIRINRVRPPNNQNQNQDQDQNHNANMHVPNQNENINNHNNDANVNIRNQNQNINAQMQNQSQNPDQNANN